MPATRYGSSPVLQGFRERARVHLPQGMPDAVDKGHRHMVGVFGPKGRIAVDVNRRPAVTGLGAHGADDRDGVHAQVAAVADQKDNPGPVHR